VRLRTITTVAVAIATGLAGCGSDKEGKQLPASSASQLEAQLNSIQSRIDNGSVGACDDITGGDEPNTTEVQRVIDRLPNDVDGDLRNAVQNSFDHLFDLVQRECRSLRDQTNTETETTPTETTETTTTPTETTDTNTTPTETTDTNTTPTTPTTTSPGNNGNGTGNGNGNSNGNGDGGGAAGPSEGGE
jgi:hypothetical protein